MAVRIYEHPHPERFVVGTIGLPGDRTFYLQAKSGPQITTVQVEKEQAEMLGERIDELLDMVRTKTEDPELVPVGYVEELVDNAGLSVPIDSEFHVGTMSLGWDTVAAHLIVECFELTRKDAEEDLSSELEDDQVERDTLRVILSGAQAREFARRTDQVVNAGRRDCPFCSLPLDPEGHICPRANGVAR